jgi:uncharacterized membrane protein YfcA
VQSALQTIREFRIFLLCGLVFLVASAQFVRLLEPQILYGFIGILVTVFTATQLLGLRPKSFKKSTRVELAAGALAGFTGGLSGVWGPPTVAYLTAIDTNKQEQIRAQGVIYGLGAVALAGAHIQTGVLRAETLPLTLAILPCALLGVWLGFKLQDRIAQQTFRTVTLVVLAIAGLNLLRRAVFG